jgi:hypothetical protein
VAGPAASICAIGRLSPDGPWVGLRRAPSGWSLVFGDPDGALRRARGVDPAVARERLIAAAAAYFAESLTDPPPDLEATHADLADLLRWLAAAEASPRASARAAEALDAIDDGLAGDAVVSLLAGYAAEYGNRSVKVEEQADPVDLLLEAYRALPPR